MGHLYWIEDNITQATEIINAIGSRCWGGEADEGVALTFYIFGDEYKRTAQEQLTTKDNVQAFNEKVRFLLSKHCRNIKKWRDASDMIKEKKQLIEKTAELIDLKDTEIQVVTDAWKNMTSLENYKNSRESAEPKETNKLDVQKILNKMPIIANEVVGIDLALLYHDIDRVYMGIPIISMELYRSLSENNTRCFLYSSYTYDYNFVQKYKEIWKEISNESIRIIREKDLFKITATGKPDEILERLTKKSEDSYG